MLAVSLSVQPDRVHVRSLVPSAVHVAALVVFHSPYEWPFLAMLLVLLGDILLQFAHWNPLVPPSVQVGSLIITATVYECAVLPILAVSFDVQPDRVQVRSFVPSAVQVAAFVVFQSPYAWPFLAMVLVLLEDTLLQFAHLNPLVPAAVQVGSLIITATVYECAVLPILAVSFAVQPLLVQERC